MNAQRVGASADAALVGHVMSGDNIHLIKPQNKLQKEGK